MTSSAASDRNGFRALAGASHGDRRKVEGGAGLERFEVPVFLPLADRDPVVGDLRTLGFEERVGNVLAQRAGDRFVGFERRDRLAERGGQRLDAVLFAFVLVELVDVLANRIGTV